MFYAPALLSSTLIPAGALPHRGASGSNARSGGRCDVLVKDPQAGRLVRATWACPHFLGEGYRSDPEAVL
jgi:hypothetical protein